MSKSIAAAMMAALLPTALLAQAPCYETSVGSSLGLTMDDGGVAVPLGFTFPFHGVPYTDISVCTNGFVWLGAAPVTTNPWDYSPSENELLTEPPRIAPCWMDLYLPQGGNIYFNTFPAGPTSPARAVVTWDQVPWLPNTAIAMTIQLQLEDNGSMQWSISASGGIPTDTYSNLLVGCSEGVAATANAIDLSSALPANSGQSSTLYEVFDPNSVIDVLGTAFQAVTNGTNGLLLLSLRQCQQAAVSAYGTGCPVLSNTAVYEQFAAAGFDLSSSSLLFVPNGTSSYIVLPGTNVWFTGFTNNLALFDDSTAAVTLPYPFLYVGGTTSTVSVSSNGFMWLGNNTNADCCNGDSVYFLSDPMARIAPLWMDLNPSAGGGVYAELDPATGEYVITWNNVPEFGQTANTITMQLALQANGVFELRYQTCANLNHNGLTGFSMGDVANDPGNSDFSSLPIVTATAQPIPPVVLAPQTGSAPRLGSTFTTEISDLPPGSVIAVYLLGFTRAGVDLSLLGMPGCFAWVDIFTPGRSSQMFVPVTTPTVPVALAIPNIPSLVGMRLFSQAAVLAPNVNAIGIATSNALQLDVGR